MRRRVIFFFFLMTCSCFVFAEERPNIILILTDDQGFDDYGFRQTSLETPVMDRLMQDGVQFTRFYTAAACAPTRSALMTGRNFMRTGTSAVGFGAESPHINEYFLSEAMKDAGYVTGMVGKWNLGLSDAELPSRRGFDNAWPVIRDDVRSYGRYEHYNPSFFYNGNYSGRENGWQVEICTDKAIDFIKKHKHKPFFLYIPYASPHEPWLCPSVLQKKYMQKGIGEHYAMFMGMMEQLDKQVGRILQTIEDLDISKNTIVLFLGDNGPTPTTRILEKQKDGFYALTSDYYNMSDQEWINRNPSGLRSKKATGWENAIRNRLTIYCPEKFEAKIIDDMTLVMDIYPTLVAFAKGKRPEGKPALNGMDLTPLINGESDWPVRAYFTGETGRPEQKYEGDGWNYRFTDQTLPLDNRETCFVMDDWVIVNEKGNWGLFDLANDIGQKKNLKKENPKKFNIMKSAYYNAFEDIKSDPHAWSDPIQEVGVKAYLELEYTFRMKGRNSVTWANTFFHEVGAIQELKVRVLEEGIYSVRLRALGVPEKTKLRFETANNILDNVLIRNQKYHNLGKIKLSAGHQIFSIKLLETSDEKAISKMELFSLELEKI